MKKKNNVINFPKKYIGKRKVKLPKRPGEPDITWADISKAKKILNWRPVITIDDGVNELISNINYWKNAPIWNKKKIKEVTKDWFKYFVAQTFKNCKKYCNVLVVNDGSEDKTGLLAKKTGAIVISNEKNMGYEYALNIGDHELFNRYSEEFFLKTSENLVENILKQY